MTDIYRSPDVSSRDFVELPGLRRFGSSPSDRIITASPARADALIDVSDRVRSQPHPAGASGQRDSGLLADMFCAAP